MVLALIDSSQRNSFSHVLILLRRACLSGFTEMRPGEGEAAIAEVVEGAQQKQNQGEAGAHLSAEGAHLSAEGAHLSAEGAHLSVAFDQLYAALAASLKVPAARALLAHEK
jgi:hypothetical protein